MEPPPRLSDDDVLSRIDRSDPWDGYLVGPENDLAQAAVRELARGIIDGSPLVIVGPSGSGKSRLLENLIADRIARRPGASVALITAEAFADACHQAADLDTPEGWAELRGRYRNVDLLAIDDLHGLNRSPLAIAELEPTLDTLETSGASVAVTVRDDPGRWEGWPRRLADRLRVGLTVRLEAPGPTLRRRYLLDRARSLGLTATAEALDALADSGDGYRTLDGWLSRLALTSRLDRRPIDPGLVDELLNDDLPSTPGVTIPEIIQGVARHFKLRPRDLRSESRRAALVEARHLAILLARDLTRTSYAGIGRAFGNRDPKTIRHGYLAASRRVAGEPAFAAIVQALRRKWQPNDLQSPRG